MKRITSFTQTQEKIWTFTEHTSQKVLTQFVHTGKQQNPSRIEHAWDSKISSTFTWFHHFVLLLQIQPEAWYWRSYTSAFILSYTGEQTHYTYFEKKSSKHEFFMKKLGYFFNSIDKHFILFHLEDAIFRTPLKWVPEFTLRNLHKLAKSQVLNSHRAPHIQAPLKNEHEEMWS